MNSVANRSVVRTQGSRAGDIGEQVSSALSAFTDQVAASVQDWRDRAQSVAKSTDRLVQSSPWQAVATGALAGLVAGVLVTYGLRRVFDRSEDRPDAL